ncbi:unnamed protein product [Mycena citricolor]|uniref:Uncharacterized protein n=1 Tax=Mycena citricolor TaxID=2018698 RepID=A0AAD2HER2_9AGAR|nr:unnamed protein product [Mycena citricolor]
MKISVLAFLFAATAVFGQSIEIGAPADGATVKAGSALVVEVDRPDTITGSTEVAVVIAVRSCVGSPCPSPADVLGTVLYNGGYNPMFHTNVTPSKPPYQNLTVTIPANLAKGPAQLNVAHVTLIGAGPFPFLETRNVSLNIV